MDADVRPLPKELTTPPVTKICRVMEIPFRQGDRRFLCVAWFLSLSQPVYLSVSYSVLNRLTDTFPQIHRKSTNCLQFAPFFYRRFDEISDWGPNAIDSNQMPNAVKHGLFT